MTGVSDDFQVECRSSILHENMKISRLMMHNKHVEEAKARGSVEMLKGQDLLMEVLQRISLRYKTRLDSRNGFLIMFLQIFLRLLVIRCLSLRLRRQTLLVHQLRRKLVENVAKNTIVILLMGQTIVFVVVNVGTRLWIALI